MGNAYYFLPTTGSASWNTGANWLKDDGTTGTVPGGVAGDSAYIEQGNADINTGLVVPTNALANLEFRGSFSGTLGTTGNTSDSMPMNATNWKVNCNATRIKLDFGSSAYTGYIVSTGASQDDPLEVVRVRGGTTGSNLYVIGGTVGVATTRPGITASLALFDISGGTLTIGAGTTVANGTQTGGALTVNCGMSGTLKQDSGTLTTNGTALIATILAGGTATLNHRVAAGSASITTLTIENDASVDFSQEPQGLQITNPIVMLKGASLTTFSPTQIILPAAAPLNLTLEKCNSEDVTLNIGKNITMTVTAGP
jgi:hypothetical protein